MKKQKLEKSLNKICKLWQKILRLEDWDIEVRIRRHYDLDRDTAGDIHIFPEKKKVVVNVIDPDDYDPEWSVKVNPELTLVHELVHIFFQPFDKPTEQHHILEEQAVHNLSKALVELAKGG